MEYTTKKYLAIAVMVFGVLGCLFSLFFLFSSFSTQAKTGNQFEIIGQSMKDASLTALHASESVESAQQSLHAASIVITKLSIVVNGLSSALDISILGVSPLEKASLSAKEMSSSVANFSSEVEKTANALSSNANDLKKLSDDFSSMSEQFYSLNGIPGSSLLGVKGIALYGFLLHAVLLLLGFLFYSTFRE